MNIAQLGRAPKLKEMVVEALKCETLAIENADVRAKLQGDSRQPVKVADRRPAASPAVTAPAWHAAAEHVIACLARYTTMLDPECTCEPCPECAKLPEDCSGTQCAQTCQCSSCDHCTATWAITGLREAIAAAESAPDAELAAWREWGRHLRFAAGQIAGTWTVVQDDTEQNSTGQPELPAVNSASRQVLPDRVLPETVSQGSAEPVRDSAQYPADPDGAEQNAAPQAIASDKGTEPTRPAVAAPLAWIATHAMGEVLHFSTHDGWRVEQVVGEQINAVGQGDQRP